MNRKLDPEQYKGLVTQVMLNPLSYIHPARLCLSHRLNTPRQRSIVNQMLLASIPGSLDWMASPQCVRQLLPYWHQLPYVCTLVGAQLLKQDLAWRGRILKLSATVRFFISLPLRQLGVTSADLPLQAAAAMPAWRKEKNPLLQVQAVGLLRLLDWQQQAPAAMLGRMRLLFPPLFDVCFEYVRQPIQTADLLLILQAMQYAKNNPNPV